MYLSVFQTQKYLLHKKMDTKNPGSNFNVEIGMIDKELENECQNQAKILVKTIIDEILSSIPIRNSENKDIDFFDIVNMNQNDRNDNFSSSATSSRSTSSSSTDCGRIYRVTNSGGNHDKDEQSDKEDDDIFYSSEDLILKFIEIGK